MSTRKLILTALVCGLAILVAGGIQLFRLKDSDPVTLPKLGETRVISGVSVTPQRVDDEGDLTVVTVSLKAADSSVQIAGNGWTLLRKDTFASVDPPGDSVSCPTLELTTSEQTCVVAFAAPGDAARFLGYRRKGAEARWALDS